MNSEFTKEDLIRILEPSKKTFISIKADISPNLPVTQSKFGGTPHFPQTMAYPKAQEGSPLLLLAQINFAELPIFENFPSEGILQFYIDAYDDLYGLNMDNYPYNIGYQEKFRVIFHPNIDEKLQKTDLPTFDWKKVYSPLTDEYALSFEVKEECVPSTDWQFEKYFGKSVYEFWTNPKHQPLWEQYVDEVTSVGHKMGGYAFFTQSDVRSTDRYDDYSLLLQIDSENNDTTNICWGDVGVGNFFIRSEDLQKRDFSQVLYTWDCM